jgi:hypothetical protein
MHKSVSRTASNCNRDATEVKEDNVLTIQNKMLRWYRHAERMGTHRLPERFSRLYIKNVEGGRREHGGYKKIHDMINLM